MNSPSDEPSLPRDPGAISESAGDGREASRDATPAEDARALDWLRGILADEGPLANEDKRKGRQKLRRLLEQEDVADLVLEILEEVGSEEALTPEGAGEAPAGSSERPETTARPVGRTLGDYRLLRFLGKGGMGVVYEAEQLSLGRRVALKILPRHSLMEPSSLKRFQLEARAAAKLSHPHIVPVHDTGVAEGMHYYAMHLVEGEGLDRVLEEVRLLQKAGSAASRPRGGQRDSSEHPAGVRLAREFLDGAFPAAPDGEPGKAPPGSLLTGDPGSRGSKGLQVSPGESPSGATEGSSSSSRWAGGTDLPPTSDSRRYFRAVARVGLQVASALACAHGQGVLHRDVKPSNLLLDVEGKVWVADFGLAKAAGGEDLTQTGEVVGSLRYMAPERFRGFSDHRSDVYGLGATLYELCTLRPAFGAADRAALVHQILHREPARPRRIDPRIPRNLETIILKALEKEPHHRYQSAQELHDDLARFLAERPIAARKLSASERSWLWCRRNPLSAALALAVAAILAAGGIGSFLAALHFRDLAGSLARQKDATNEQLWSARVAQARSERQGQRIGQRESSLSAIVQAAEIRPSLELRDEAIAALGLVDFKPVWKIDLPVSPGFPFAFDPRLRRYAFADAEGAIHVCDVGGGEVAVFGGILDHSSRDGSLRRSNSSDTSEETGAARADAAVDSRDLPGLRFSPDGRFLLVHGSSDGWALAIEERERYSLAWSLPLWQQCVDWSADGRLLAIAGHSSEERRREIVLVDMKEAREVLRVATGSQAVLALRFSPGGQAVAVATHGEILLLRIAGGSLESWLPQQAVPNSFDWDPRGRLLACAGSDGAVRLWDLESRTVRETFSGAHDKRKQVLFDPTGRFLVTTAAGELNSLWDLRSSSLALRFSGEGLVWGPEGRMGRRVGATAEILEMVAEEEYRCLFQSAWKGAEARSLALSRDGSLVAWSSLLGIRLWDLEGPREIAKLSSRTIPTSLSSDGAGLVVATPLSQWLWPIGEVREGPEEVLQIGPPRPWAPAAPAEALAVAHHRSGLYLYEQERPEDGILLRVPIGAEDTLASARVSPDRSWAAAVTRGGGEVFVWNLDRKRPVAGMPLELRSQAARACDFSPDSRWLVITCEAAYEFVRKDSREVFARIPRDPSTSSQPSAAFSEDGTVAAVLISGSTIGLVDMNEGEVVAHFSLLGEFSGASPSCLQLSPDGTQLAAGARGGSVHVWDLSQIRERLESFGLAEGFPRMAAQRRSRALPLRTRIASGTWMKDLKGKSVNPADPAGSESRSGGLEARIAEAIEKRLRESERP